MNNKINISVINLFNGDYKLFQIIFIISFNDFTTIIDLITWTAAYIYSTFTNFKCLIIEISYVYIFIINIYIFIYSTITFIFSFLTTKTVHVQSDTVSLECEHVSNKRDSNLASISGTSVGGVT